MIRRKTQLFLLQLFVLLAASVRAERLPLRSYTAADGLPHDRVKRIVADRRGFVWFATLEGLARFDGRDFVSYGVAEGLGAPSVNDIVETQRGFWVATNGEGVAFFDPDAVAPHFLPLAVGRDAGARVNVLALDRGGTLWAGTDGGLFRLTPSARSRFSAVPLAGASLEPASPVFALLPCEAGLLVGTLRGLFLVPPSGPPRHIPGDGVAAEVFALAAAGDGRILVGNGSNHGLLILDAHSLAPLGRLTTQDGLPNGVVTALLVSGRRIFIGTDSGLAVLASGRVDAYGTREGLSDGRVSSLAEDADGGIWIGTPESGAMRLQDTRATIYDDEDGLRRINHFFAGPGGVPCASGFAWAISCFEGRDFTTVRPALAQRLGTAAWRGHYGVLRDSLGEFWLGTGEGLYRFAAPARLGDLARAAPLAIYRAADGLATDDTSDLMEDRAGNVWIGSFSPLPDPLTVWWRNGGRFERFGAAAGLPSFGSPSLLTLDSAGNLWIAYRDGTLARRRNGSFRVLSGANGFPRAPAAGFARDPAGGLWVTTTGAGLLHVPRPDDVEPRAITYGSREGVTGYYLGSPVVDDTGRVVFGSDRELLRLDPARGTIENILPERVLVQSSPCCTFRDAAGALWLGTWRGVLRVLPDAERRRLPPRVRISGVTVAGTERPVPATGVETLDLGVLPASANVSFRLFGLGAIGESLQYTHFVEGLEQKWSTPIAERQIHFEQFAPGRYRFHVRAVGGSGGSSPEAVVAFTVLAPVWLRWWFLAGVALLLTGGGWGVEALRVRHRLALDGLRRRIASDLHDDLGSGLSRISMLSEVATLALESGASPGETVAKIRDASRDVDERLAEGIWAVDPAHDDVGSLGARVCLLAGELLDAAGVAWRVEMAPETEKVLLRPDDRREIYLLLKEALTNAARHAHAHHLTVKFVVARRRLRIEVADDGIGFDPDAATRTRLVGGHGLANMRARAVALGGSLRIDSAAGRGTVLHLEVSIAPRHVRTRT